MPKCGSQCVLCNVPIRIDSYEGCSHGCKYCFVFRKYDISKIKAGETVAALKNFINGQRNQETSWCDWNIPLHWGGCSDPFQPIERTKKISLEMLKLFAETKYPFIVSTKAVLPLEQPYFDLFKECNCVFQCSMVAPSFCEKFEKGAPTFEQRLDMIKKMSEIVPRTIARCQPYVIQYHKEIKEQIPRLADSGVYGITYEAIKMQTKVKGFEKNGADFVYPLEHLKPKFEELKETCHKYGIKFLSGENRLRNLGDSLTCCGCEGLDGFEVNKANLNQLLFAPEDYTFTKRMEEKGTSHCFKGLYQKTGGHKLFQNYSYKELMNLYAKDRKALKSLYGKQ